MRQKIAYYAIKIAYYAEKQHIMRHLCDQYNLLSNNTLIPYTNISLDFPTRIFDPNIRVLVPYTGFVVGFYSQNIYLSNYLSNYQLHKFTCTLVVIDTRTQFSIQLTGSAAQYVQTNNTYKIRTFV